MRNVFLALVLANLAFAAWHAWFSGPAAPSARPGDDAPTLTLVSELPDDLRRLPESPVAAGATAPQAAPPESAAPQASPPESAAPPGSAAVAATAAGEAAHCTTVGPFRDLAQAATAAATLRSAGYEPSQRVAEGDIWIGYWLYIDGIATEAEANEILAKVRADGVTDSYVIPGTDSGNLVSLGVFSEISGVSTRRDQVRALGYVPKVVDRTRRATVYWVDVLLAGDATLDFEALQPPGRILRLEQRECDDPG